MTENKQEFGARCKRIYPFHKQIQYSDFKTFAFVVLLYFANYFQRLFS